MIVLVEWRTFHAMFLNTNNVYIKETDEAFEIWTHDGPFKIKSVVEKKDEQEENFMFIERYLTGRTNVIRVMGMIGYEETNVEEESSPTISEDSIREEDRDPLDDDLEEDLEMTDADYVDKLEEVE